MSSQIAFFPSSVTYSLCPSKLGYNKSTLVFPKKSKVINKGFRVQSEASSRVDDGDHNSLPETPGWKVERRNLLLGLGGLYAGAAGAADLTTPVDNGGDRFLKYPDISKCTNSNVNNELTPYCCPPPLGDKEISRFDPTGEVTKKRLAAHLVDDEYIEKYKHAIRAMKCLPEDDPRNFYQQAKIHCAYCNKGHRILSSENQETTFDVHGNWFFAPFHRWYIYFFERIAGELIGDPTFALPYWNWDDPEGMKIPEMFLGDAKAYSPNPLDNPNRNPKHLNEMVNFIRNDTTTDKEALINNNLSVVYLNMITVGVNAEKFHGLPIYRDTPENKPKGTGALEQLHNPVHGWVGKPRTEDPKSYGEDMGNFYSAARDAIFYSHHANVDRLWSLWQGKGLEDKMDPDKAKAWKDSQFFFYDEKANPVFVTVGDCLDIKNLGYEYPESEKIKWLLDRPKPLPSSDEGKAMPKKAEVATDLFKSRQKLEKVIRCKVKRPNKDDSTLVIEGVELKPSSDAQFLVYVKDELSDKVPMFAYLFTNVPSGPASADEQNIITDVRIPLKKINPTLTDEFKPEGDLVVILIPKAGVGDVTITNIKVEDD